MKTITLYLILLVQTVLLTSCTTLHKGLVFTGLQDAVADKALVYVYRVGVPPYWRSPKMLFNGKEVMVVKNESYTTFELKPGKYEIQTKWPLDLSFINQTGYFWFDAGERYFLKLDGRMDFNYLGGTTIVSSTKSRLIMLPGPVAFDELKHCMYIDPMN